MPALYWASKNPALSSRFLSDTSASYQLSTTMLVSSKHLLATNIPMDLEEDAGARMPREADMMRHHVSVAGGDDQPRKRNQRF